MTRWRKAYLAAAIVIGLGVALVAAVGWYARSELILVGYLWPPQKTAIGLVPLSLAPA